MGNRKVLVVEDESLIARALTKILNKFNYEIVGIVNDSDAALNLLQDTNPDIILMDIRIDGKLDGIQTAELIMANYDIPIVYMSSLDDQTTIDRAKETLPFGYVTKPFEEKDIKIALEMSLLQYEMEKKLRQSEARYRSVVTSLNEGIILLNSEFLIETCNPAAEKIIGESADELVGHSILNKKWEILSAQDEPIEIRDLVVSETGLISKSIHDVQLKYKNKSGQYIYLIVNFEPVCEGGGSKTEVKSLVCSFKDITAQKYAEDAYKAIVDNSIQGLIVFQDEKIIFANNAVENILGYSPEQFRNFTYEDLAELANESDSDVLENIFRIENIQNKQIRQIIALRKADGEYTWLETYSSRFKLRGKDALQIVFVDISDKKAAEQMLIDSEERFRSLFHNSYDGIALTDESGSITEWNSAMEKITGINHSVASGMKIWEMQVMFSQSPVNIDRQRILKNTYEVFYKSGKAPWLNSLIEFNLQKHTGDVITIQQVSFKIKTRKGYIICSMNRDISELMQTRKAQLESENRLRLAMEAVNDALWDINPTNESILYLSPKWFTMLGYSSEEFSHSFETFFRFIHADDLDKFKNKIERIINGTETAIRIEFRMLAANKRYKWILARGKALSYDAQGKANRLIGTNIDIDERKKMEFAIKENEHTIRTLLDATNEPIGLFSAEGRIIAINNASAKALDKSVGELLGRNYFDFLPAASTELHKGVVAKVIETGLHSTFIETHNNSSIEHSIYPILDARKRVSGVAAYSKDLTHIFETQNQLRQSEERYRLLFEETPISHWIIDLSEVKEFLDKMKHIGIDDFETFIHSLHFEENNDFLKVKMIDVNHYTLELFEADSKQQFFDYFCELFLSDAFTSLKKLFVKLFEGSTRFEGENVMRTVKGNLIYGYWKFAIAPGYENTWKKVMVSGIDMSAKKKIEFALQESEKTLRAIIYATPIGIGMVKDRVLLWANQPFFDVFGYTEKELINKNLSVLYRTSHEAEIAGKKLYSQVNEFGLGTSELEFVKGNGERVECLVMAKAIDQNSRDTGQILAVMDITDRKKAEEQKRNINKLTIEAEKQKNEAIQLINKSALLASIGVIAGGITHEINQPLNAVRMGADGILFWNKQHKVLPEMMTEMLEGISEAASRIDEIIKHMRSFWVEPNNKQFELISLNSGVEKAVSLISQKLQSSEIQLKLFTSEEDLRVKANPVQLELIINNLIINSANALKGSDIKEKWIKINTHKDSQYIYLEISDNGIGLPEDVDTAKLFDPFFSTRKPQEGTGLGLAIVKMFADRFGAKITARNLPGRGAIFTIFFSIESETKAELAD